MANVLILGATSAIAQEVAKRYAERGDRLFVVGRNPAKLAALVSGLGPSCVGSLVADLDDTDANARRVDEALDALGSIDVGLVAHGLLGDQLETERSWDSAEAVLRTNLLSVVSLVIPLANALEEQGRGHLAVMSSVAGERGRPRNYTYGAAKGASTLYLQGVRSRLWAAGVEVHTLKLGPVDTPMTETHPKNALFATAEGVASSIVRLLDGPGGEAYVPKYWAPIMGVVRNLPEPLFQRLKFLSGR
ncbi:MAG: SDR family NAD(P)-dependent oxidoreductase [Nannocystaceae bacterium]|nr:SDR family NAD(P)-dependent oxidoreductase [bacterium]